MAALRNRSRQRSPSHFLTVGSVSVRGSSVTLCAKGGDQGVVVAGVEQGLDLGHGSEGRDEPGASPVECCAVTDSMVRHRAAVDVWC
jgi:hypothetical protein